MIRRATVEDIDAIVAMGVDFQASTAYARHLRATPETLRALAVSLIASDEAVILVAERDGTLIGMLAAGLYTQPMSAECVGSEICWWVTPAARGGRAALRLLQAAEAWAKSRGAVVFQMMAPNEDVGAFYEALRFERIETHYQRRIA